MVRLTTKTSGVTFGFSIRGALILVVIMFSPNIVQAACLGLGVPAPQNTNVCETLVEQLVVPTIKLSCDVPIFAPPHCHIPGACHGDPTCKAFETTKQIGSHVLNAGDLYCDFRKVDPKKMIENIAQGVYTDTVKLTTGGTSSALYNVASFHIDSLECSAKGLEPSLKDVIGNLVAPTPLSRNLYFFPIDVDRVGIIRRSFPLGDVYLRDGYDAITLDAVVIIQDPKYRLLSSWKRTWNDVMFGQLNVAQEDALFLMIHELVHVRQYRAMGREQFINRYLAEAVARGYANISTEREAVRFAEWAREEYDRTRATWAAILATSSIY